MNDKISGLAVRIIEGKTTRGEDYRILFEDWEENFDEIIFWANKIRSHFKGKWVKLCSIINAKSGMCSEDCRFCAQSSLSRGDVKVYPLLDKDAIISAYESCAKRGIASCFGIVTSGESPSEDEIKNIGDAVAEIKKKNLKVKISASLGRLDFDSLRYLKEKGLDVYHHNLETAKSFFKNICTTHSYESKIETVKNARSAGLKICSGGIFGLGENPLQRFEMSCALKDILPDSIPLNFFNPVRGAPLSDMGTPRLRPKEILAIIAAFRFMFPDKDIRVCGGREVNLRDMQSWIFSAGANGMMTGGYLTTPGRSPEEDRDMIKDTGFEVE